jgi:hypothetical protein
MARTLREDTYKARWIRKLLNEGVKPDLVVLETTDADKWQERERHYIATIEDLTNTSAGGEGVDAPRTEEWCRRIGESQRGKVISEENKRKLREANLAKHAAGCKNGHPWTEENTIIAHKMDQAYRVCRICRNENQKARYRKINGGLKGRKKFVKKNKQEFCKRGHILNGDNLRICVRRGTTERLCRECVRIRNRKAKEVTRARALVRTSPPKQKPHTHCKNGHEYNEANIGYTNWGYRYCKKCDLLYARKYRRGKTMVAERGCGRRCAGAVYCECPLSPFGLPIESFLVDPPIVVDTQSLGVTPIGVKLVERNGVWHILDWVGSTHYANVADFFEEVRRLGLSRRLSTTLDFKKLTPQSRILLLHARAHIENYGEYQSKEPARDELLGMVPYADCPKGLPEHTRPQMETMCARLWYQDVTQGEAVEVSEDETSEARKRCVTRKMPSFEYHALTAPEDVEPTYKVAIFASFPITNLAVVKDNEGGSHNRSMMLAEQARIPVELVDE